MNHEAIGKIMDRWTNDAAFRAQMRVNPEATVKSCDMTLGADELAALRRVDWSQSDEQLQARISKPVCL